MASTETGSLGLTMETRPIPGLDIPCSRFALGTMTFGAAVGPEEASAMVNLALDAGVTMFDTANIYTAGASERFLGRALGNRRREVVIATKAHHRHGPGAHESGLSPAALRVALDASLVRLGTDWVDLLYFHQPDWTVPLEESLGAAHGLVQAGKARVVALSNYPSWEIARGQATAMRHGWPEPRIHQVMYNLLARGLEDEYAEFAWQAGVFNIVYNPLAGGLLTGRYINPTKSPGAGRFATDEYRKRYWHDSVFKAVNRLDNIARAAGLSLLELAFAWLASRPLVDVVLLGASSLRQLQINLAATAGPALPANALVASDDVWDDLRGPVPRYWR